MSLRLKRKKAGMTLFKLADASGLNYMHVYRIEIGDIDIERIQLKTAIKLANALGCEPKDLLDKGQV